MTPRPQMPCIKCGSVKGWKGPTYVGGFHIDCGMGTLVQGSESRDKEQSMMWIPRWVITVLLLWLIYEGSRWALVGVLFLQALANEFAAMDVRR